MLRALTTLLTEYSGEIIWQGEDSRRQRHDLLSQLLFIGHLPGIRQHLTPRENLRFLSELHHHLHKKQIHKKQSQIAIDYALNQVGLYGYEDMPGHQLSAGQQRRVALARLYLSQAPLWVLDEPYTAIDQQGIAHIETLLSQHAERGGTVILTSHQPPQLSHLRQLHLLDYQPRQLAA